MDSDQTVLLTIDVEDWFQVENFKAYIPFSTWDQYELRVERNVHRLLDLFDSVEVGNHLQNGWRQNAGTLNPESWQPKATFFVLGWISERLPHLVREIHRRGHEVASHGLNHALSDRQPFHELVEDLTDSKKQLEDIIGAKVFGFRAPSFAITQDILTVVEDCGYTYDSSYNCFGWHGRYGVLSLNGDKKEGIAYCVSDSFFELPLSNLRLANQIIPLAGGGYFRLIPFVLFCQGVRTILRKQKAYLFYLHPWEIDPGQPRMKQCSLNRKFRHYIRINKTFAKFSKFMHGFRHCNFTSCLAYLRHWRPCISKIPVTDPVGSVEIQRTGLR